MDPAADLTGVTRAFGAVPALDRTDLRVERGQAVLVRGPNGAGKSTLLAIVATALAPSRGGGTVLGHDLRTGRERIRAGTELLAHRTRLYEDLSAAENLRLTAGLYRLPRARATAALDRVGLGGVAHERVAGFSDGMRRRVALARLVLREPELAVLDEPYAGLDEDARALVDEIVAGLLTTGRTVLVAGHDHTGRATWADRVVTLRAGRITADVPAGRSASGVA